MSKCFLSACFIVFTLWSGHLIAKDGVVSNSTLLAVGNHQNSKQVRRTSDKIKASPEFRHLRDIIVKDIAPDMGSGNGSGGSGSGGTGNGQGGSGSGQGNSSGSQGNGSNGQGGNGSNGNGKGGSGLGSGGTTSGSSGTGSGSGGNGSGSGSGNGNSGSGGNGNNSGSQGTGGGQQGNSTPSGGSSSSSSVPSPSSSIQPASSAASAALGGLGTLITMLFWLIIAVVAMAMIYFIVKAFLDRDTSESPDDENDPLITTSEIEEEPERPPGEIPADVYIARARELAAQGLYNEAVAQLLLGAMSKIERSGFIKYRRGLTNRDYMRAIRSKQGPHQAFRLIVRTYEPIGFGRRNANESHFEKSLSGYEQGFKSVLESA